MSARNARTMFAAVLATVLLAACTHSAPADAPRRSFSHEWSTTVAWPFSLATDERDVVVTVSRGRVIDLDARTGRERWRAALGRVTRQDPALDGDSVLISAEDRFVALSRESGELRWERSMGGQPGGVALTRVDGGPIALVTTTPGVIAALDAGTGDVRWTVQVPGTIDAPPAVDAAAGIGAVVWSGERDAPTGLSVFDLATGSTRWERPIAVSASAPVVQRGTVIVGEGDGHFEARVVGRDLASGAERWSTVVPASFEAGLIPGADDDEVAVTDHFGTVTLVDAGSGTPRWQTPLREPILATGVVIRGHFVALTTYGGRVVILDRASGRIVRRMEPGGAPVGAGVSGPRLVFAVRLAAPDRVEAIRLP